MAQWRTHSRLGWRTITLLDGPLACRSSSGNYTNLTNDIFINSSLMWYTNTGYFTEKCLAPMVKWGAQFAHWEIFRPPNSWTVQVICPVCKLCKVPAHFTYWVKKCFSSWTGQTHNRGGNIYPRPKYTYIFHPYKIFRRKAMPSVRRILILYSPKHIYSPSPSA